MGKKGFDICLFQKQHSDCFALQVDGRCFCLHDTNFMDRTECPFYKVSSDVDPRVTRKIAMLNRDIERRRKVIR